MKVPKRVLSRNRGGEAAHGALLLALLSLSGGFCGCGKTPTAVNNRHSVRIEALLPLHPAWAQVDSLDRSITLFTRPSALSGTVAPALPPLPAGFAPPHDLPATDPKLGQKRDVQATQQYIQQLAATLRLQDEAYLTRLARRQFQEIQATYQKDLLARQAAIHAERVRAAGELDRQITRLKLRDVAFQTQLVYKDQARQDALLQHRALLAQIADLTQKADTLLDATVILNTATTDLQPRREQLQKQAAEQLAQEKQSLTARRAERLKKERENLNFEPDPLPPINTSPLPPPDFRETPLALPSGPQASSAFQAANATVTQAALARQSAWKAQRDRLIAAIRADTQQAVQQIARQRGWTLASAGTKDAPDETEAIKPLLKAQWQQGRTN